MERLLLVSLALATGVLALGFILSGWPFLAPLALLPGGAALVAHWRGWNWLSSLALVLFAGMAALGIWFKAGAGWMLGGVVAALTAWDLETFSQQLRRAGPAQDKARMERQHLRRLLAVDLLGLLLGGAALLLHLRFSLFWALVLGVLLIAGLTQVVSFLQRESK